MSDGYVDAALGLAHVDLPMFERPTSIIQSRLTLDVDFAYQAADGTVLYSRKIQSIGSWRGRSFRVFV